MHVCVCTCDCEKSHVLLFSQHTCLCKNRKPKGKKEGRRFGWVHEPAAWLSPSSASLRAFFTHSTHLPFCLLGTQGRRRYGSPWWVYLELWRNYSLPIEAAGQVLPTLTGRPVHWQAVNGIKPDKATKCWDFKHTRGLLA